MKNQFLALELDRAREQLRQEIEIFEQGQLQRSRWFSLRLFMGYTSIFLTTSIMIGAFYIMFKNKEFPTFVVASAVSALHVSILGMLLGVWRIALNRDSAEKVIPVTKVILSGVKSFRKTPTKPLFHELEHEGG